MPIQQLLVARLRPAFGNEYQPAFAAREMLFQHFRYVRLNVDCPSRVVVSGTLRHPSPHATPHVHHVAVTGQEATYEFVRRLVFSVLIGNADMHLKNWSLLYPDRRTPVLSPAYDFVATLPYLPNDDSALNFGGSRSLAEISMGQMRHFADAARIPASPLWQIAVETAARTIAEWKAIEQKDLLAKDMRASIEKQI